MSAPIFTYSATELAELARLDDAERAALAVWNTAATALAQSLDGAAYEAWAAYDAWLAASKAASDCAMRLSTIPPQD